MDGYLKQSTAGQTRWVGPFVDDTDFKTAETGLTIANTDIKVSKNGGASASKNSGGGTHDVNGMYAVTWDATDTATVGELKYSIKVAGALQVFGSYVVVEEAVYDALFAASAPGYLQPATAGRTLVVDAAGLADANVVKVGPTGSGTAQTAGDIMADTNDIQTRLPAALVSGRMDVSVGAMAANVLTATAINADAITAAKVADGTIDAATFAAGAINAAAIAADAITAAKIADGAIDAATFAAGAINAAAIAADAITDAKVASDVTIASVTGAVGSVTGAVGSVTAGVTVASGGIGAGAHSAAELNAIADANLDRNMATGTDSGTDSTAVRTPRQALRRMRNKETIVAGTLTISKEDDSTASWTAAVTTAAGNPVSAVDPT